MPKIFVSVVPFGEIDPKPLELLKQTGWEIGFNSLGRKLTAAEIAEFAKGADGIIASTEDLDYLIKNSVNLKMISKVGVGLDSVPLKECRNRGIKISYTPDAVTMAVAELAVGIMISLTRFVFPADRLIRQDQWKRLIGKRIGESTIGIIGLGRVGLNVVRLLMPFKPQKLLINDIKDKTETLHELKKNDFNIIQTSKEEIYSQSDIVSLHVPLTSKTRNMVNKETLSLFRKESFLINLARGGIVNENDLYDVLHAGKINGAALDVFEQEPYHGNLRDLDNVLLTSHMGSCSFDCRLNMELEATEEIIRFFSGKNLQNEVPVKEYSYQEEE